MRAWITPLNSYRPALYLLLFLTTFVSPPTGYCSDKATTAHFDRLAEASVNAHDTRLKKKKKKNKKSGKKGKGAITLNLKNRQYQYNRKTVYLKHKVKVQICNKDQFFHEPISIGPSDGLYEFGQLKPRKCKTKRFVNNDPDVRRLEFFDSIHPDESAPFCVYPKDQRCTKGAYAATSTGGIDSCFLEETCCGDNEDNDRDGDVDCEDRDCLGKGDCDECEDFQIPAQFVIKTAYSSNGNNCGTISIVEWSDYDDEGAVSWTVNYSWNGVPRNYISSPPFDDSFDLHGTTFNAPDGYHWDTIGGGTHASNFTGDADCSQFYDNYTAALSNPFVAVRICK